MILFTKMQGTGNDFIIINCMNQYFNYSLNTLAKYLCDRNFGIGADGVIYLFKTYKADCKIRIFNSDGTEAEMCGNGIRCVGKFLYEYGIVQKEHLKIETIVDIKELELLVENKRVLEVKVNLNKPILDIRKMPVFLPRESIISKVPNVKIEIENLEYIFYLVSLGNPHAVCFVSNLEEVDVRKIGEIVENYRYFPNKINVEFAKIIDKNNIKIKVWERGVGETLSCGSGACAAVVCGRKIGELNNEVSVELDGGKLKVEFEDKISLIGDAEIVYEGKINI